MNYKVTVELIENDYNYRSSLKVYHNEELILEEWDGGEPEDNSFGRDWSWIASELEKAYHLGFMDGIDNANDLIKHNV